jgi:urease accessory protein
MEEVAGMLQDRSSLPRTEGSVRLSFAQTDGRTTLAGLHQCGASRVRFPKAAAGAVPEAVLLNTAGGLTGGDCLDVDVRLDARCSVTGTSATAEKIYRSLEGDTKVRVRLELGERARLAWLPQPTILFDSARLDRRTDVAMSHGAMLLAVEILIFGRAAMGEKVNSGSVRDAWRVRRDGRLAFADTFRVEGAIAEALDRSATLNGARAVGMLLYAGTDAPVRLDEARALLQPAKSLAGASSWDDLLVVRAFAGDGRMLQNDLEPLIVRLSGRPLPRVWRC